MPVASTGYQEALSRNKEATGHALADALQQTGPKLLKDTARFTRRMSLQLTPSLKQIGYGAGVASGGYYILPLVAPASVSNGTTTVGLGAILLGLNNLKNSITTPTDRRPESVKQLVKAARKGDTQELQRLIGAKVHLDGLDNESCTALYRAAEHGHLPAANLLIDTGANLQLGSINEKRTPLWVASEKGHAPIVYALIDGKAALDIPDKQGLTPLRIATLNGHEEVGKALISAGADYSRLDQDKAFFKALDQYNKSVLDAKRRLRKDSTKAYTALSKAAANGNLKAVCAFIGARADLNLPDNEGRTPLALAVGNGHTEIANALRAAGAKD
jgi:ankyrin repeat protein